MRPNIILVSVFALLLLAGVSFAATNISSCTNISSPGVYELNTSISGAPLNLPEIPTLTLACIKIASDDVVFDCAGYDLTCGVGDSAGIIINGSTSVDYTNVTIRNCHGISQCSVGVYVYDSPDNILTNNTPYSNTNYGIWINESSNITLTENAPYLNVYGAYILRSDNLTLINNTFHSNSIYGIAAHGTGDFESYNDHFFNQTTYGDIYLYSPSSPMPVYFSNLTIDNPLGNMENYTSLTINDTIESSTAYLIKWTSNSTKLPGVQKSFEQKFVNITTWAGAVSIDEITWHWDDSELGGYDETLFELWKYDGSAWGKVNGTPDTTANTLTLTNHNPASDYGILQLEFTVGDCALIDVPGSYQLTADLVGAPIDASDIFPALVDWACIKIASENVTLDCDGHSVTNDGTADAAGIAINGTNTVEYPNVTIMDCLGVSGYLNGVLVHNSNYDIVDNVTAFNNTVGLRLKTVEETLVYDLTAYNNTFGFLPDVIPDGSHAFDFYYGFFYSNEYDVYINNTGFDSDNNHTITETVFTNPTGTLENFTMLSMNDTVDGFEGYYINWTQNSTSLPPDKTSFEQKFVEISNFTALAKTTIDIAVWHWDDSELGGYIEGLFELWEYGAGTWGEVNGTPDTAANTLSLVNFNVSSDYGILQANNTLSSCAEIDSSGYYDLGADLTGAPIDASSVSDISWACIDIDTSDVVLDCKGHTITNDGTADAAGVVVNGTSAIPLANITLINCPEVSGYEKGVYLLNSSDNNLTNNTANNNTEYGFCIYFTDSSDFVENTAYNNSFKGFGLYSSNNNTMTSNIAYDTLFEDGFYLSSSNNNTLTNNTAYSNNQYGFYTTSTDNNTLTDNLAYLNDKGIILVSTTNSTLTNNTGHSNNEEGVFVTSSSNNNTLTDITAYNNSYSGMRIYGSSNNTFTNSRSYNNSQAGLSIEFGSDGTVLTNSIMYDNLHYGLSISNSNDTSSYGAHLYNNALGAFAAGTTDATPRTLYLSNLTADNPLGGMENYTSLTVNDTVEAGATYEIVWTTNSTQLPPTAFSFEEKFVDITTTAGTASIDSITWNWLDAELGATYTESLFQLWKYNVSDGWTMLNNTPDTGANTLTLTNHNPASEYGILQYNDTIAPNITIESPTNTTYNFSTVDINYTVSDDQAVGYCWYYLNGAGPTDLPGCANTTLAPGDGSYNLTIFVNDTSNNTNSSTVYFIIDTTDPVVTILSPTNDTYNTSSTVVFNFTAVDANPGYCWYYLNGAGPYNLPGCANTTLGPLANGPYNLTLYANDSVNNTGSDSLIFTMNYTAPPSGPPPSPSEDKDLRLSYSVICPGDIVVFEAEEVNGPAVSDVRLTLYNVQTSTYIATKYTNAAGEAEFVMPLLEGTYYVHILRSHYDYDTPYVFTYELCAECVDDDDCPDNMMCSNGQCVEVPCECGYVENHRCVEYDCCADEDCDQGQICQNHQCVPFCADDDDCPDYQYCLDGQCTDVECLCGDIQDHRCIEYECCADEDCDQGYYCENNVCILKEFHLDIDETGDVGRDQGGRVFKNGEPAPNQPLRIIAPDQRTYDITADESGNFIVPLMNKGTYVVEVLEGGLVVEDASVEALVPPQPPEERGLLALLEELGPCLAVMVIVGLGAAIFWLWKKRTEKRGRRKMK